MVQTEPLSFLSTMGQQKIKMKNVSTGEGNEIKDSKKR
jgi:hypothetical protein